MKIFGIHLWGKKEESQQVDSTTEPTALPAIRNENATVVIAKIKRLGSPVLSFKGRPGAIEFEQPEYDLAESGRIEDVESYVARAFTQKSGLMFKEGYELTGKNPETIRYIKRRFDQFSVATNEPFVITLCNRAEELVRVHNTFLVKVRSVDASGGKERKGPNGSVIRPVAGYFPVPPSTMRFKRDDKGKILKYRQQLPSGKYVEFNPQDIIHIYFNRKCGFLIGTPPLVPIKDDIRALRRIEENIEMLIYQHLFPLYHYKVGTELAPASTYPDGTREIDFVKQQIEIMPAEGMIVTPERHEITAIGAEGRALRAEAYLEHFKRRIFAGLGVSAIDMGEGDSANRSTADNMSRNMVDNVKHYQKVFAEFVNEFIIKELLLESTFDDPLSDENLVFLRFNEIDVDAKIKVQNHSINAFAGHAITHSELRKEFGKEPFEDEDWDDSFWTLIEEPKALISAVDEPYLAAAAVVSSEETSVTPEDQGAAQAAREKEAELEAKTQTKIARSRPRQTGSRPSRGARAAKAATTPSNQHGTKTSPEKRKSGLWTDAVGENFISSLYKDLESNTFYSITNNTFTSDWFKQLALASRTRMRDDLARTMRISARDGYRSAKHDISPVDMTSMSMAIENRAERLVTRFVDHLIDRITSAYDRNSTAEQNRINISAVFDSMRTRSKYIGATERYKAHQYGIARGLQASGETHAAVIFSDNACDECLKHGDAMTLTNITIDSVPCFHPNCTCRLARIETE